MTPARRLGAVRQALLGEKPHRGRASIDDELLLFPIVAEMQKPEMDQWMRALKRLLSEEGQVAYQAEIDRPPLSARDAARRAVDGTARDPSIQPESWIDRLRRKAAEADLTSQDIADLAGLVQGNSAKAELLARLISELRSLGISVNSPLGQKDPE